jgi:hypothetical protein
VPACFVFSVASVRWAFYLPFGLVVFFGGFALFGMIYLLKWYALNDYFFSAFSQNTQSFKTYQAWVS